MSEPPHSTIPPTPPSLTDAFAENALNRRQVRWVALLLVFMAIIDLAMGYQLMDMLGVIDTLQKLLFGKLFIVLAIGLLYTWRWTRMGTIVTLVVRFAVLTGITVAALADMLRRYYLFGIFADLLFPLIFCLIVYAAIIHALTRPGVKALFEEK